MYSQEVYKICNQITSSSSKLKKYQKKLIEFQTNIISSISSMVKDVNFFSDIIAIAIDNFNNSFKLFPKRKSQILKNFIRGLYLLAKAQYRAVVKKKRAAMEDALTKGISLFIDNIETIVGVVS